MAYDFTSIMERQGMDVIAVDGFGLGGAAPDAPAEGFDAIPMWVADMSFPTAPSITRAMAKRIEHPAFGYFSPRDACHQAIIDWRRRRNGVGGLEPGHMATRAESLEAWSRRSRPLRHQATPCFSTVPPT